MPLVFRLRIRIIHPNDMHAECIPLANLEMHASVTVMHFIWIYVSQDFIPLMSFSIKSQSQTNININDLHFLFYPIFVLDEFLCFPVGGLSQLFRTKFIVCHALFTVANA